MTRRDEQTRCLSRHQRTHSILLELRAEPKAESRAGGLPRPSAVRLALPGDSSLMRRLILRVLRHSLDKVSRLAERQAFPHCGAASRSLRALRKSGGNYELHGRRKGTRAAFR